MSHSPTSRIALMVVDVQRAFDQWEAAGKRRNNPDAVDGDAHSAEDIHAMTLSNLNDEFARIVSAAAAIDALRDK